MLGNKVSVFGGTGFIGREVVNALSNAGYEIAFVVRRPERYRDFALYPNTTVTTLTDFDNEVELAAAVAGADILINLTPDRSTGTEMIEQDVLSHVTQKIKSAAERAGVKRVISLSQMGASSDAPNSDWLGLLAEVDTMMHGVVNADVTILKPSLLIGENDDTTTRFAKQLNRMPLLMVAQSNTVVQPLWVKDFAQALVSTIRNPDTFGEKLDVAGEERMSLKSLGELVAGLMQKEAIVFPMCRLNANIMAKLGGLAPVASVSSSQLFMLKNDMISESDFSSQFGFAPSGLEWVISTYVAPHHIRERYNYYRKEAGRDASELV
ncbi:MAG: NAD(P)H-binding protein [Gammaproteobacteria bacterium]|nr:NAD(P)H-binding protein [Gammaproteobacteria bacterium]